MNSIKNFLNKEHALFIGLSLLAGIFYVLISIVPHFNFQTNAYDLGIFNQALYQYSHFQLGPNSVRGVSTLMADHFEPIMFLFSPFYWLFGSYSLLILQIAFSIFGGLGVYLLVKKETESKKLALTATTIYYLFFGLLTALSFDYHNNTIATTLIPWLFYSLRTKHIKSYYLTLLIFLFCKENIALISLFLGISILIFEQGKMKKHGVATIIISIIYFFIALQIIELLNHGQYQHWPYTALGNSPIEAAKNIIIHPFDTISLLFNHPTKMRMWALILASGGALAILKPKYSILLIPIIAQKFFSSEEVHWGYTFHYAVEFAPIIAIASTLAIQKFPQKTHNILIILLIITNLGILTQIKTYNGQKIGQIFSKEYYTNSQKEELNQALQLIPQSSSVSAQNTLVPHLEDREVYLLPNNKQTEFIIIDTNNDNIWPLMNHQELLNELENLKANEQYKIEYQKNGIYLFRLQK